MFDEVIMIAMAYYNITNMKISAIGPLQTLFSYFAFCNTDRRTEDASGDEKETWLSNLSCLVFRVVLLTKLRLLFSRRSPLFYLDVRQYDNTDGEERTQTSFRFL